MYIQKSYDNRLSLYVIPTPIGNLEDITIRSLNILKELDILYCEDTRVTKKLLNHYEINVKVVTYNEYSDDKVNEEILKNLKNGLKLGLVSDAGMPLISDPGFKLVNFLKKKEVNIIILPGACAFLQPMVYFCFDNSPYIFRGFLSKHKATYKKEISNIAKEYNNTIIYETPHRIEKTLDYLSLENLNNQVLIAREISKIYENYIEGTIDEVLQYVREKHLKGEIVLIVGKPNEEHLDIDYLDEVIKLTDEGIPLKQATKEIASKYDISKNKLYNEYIAYKNE